MTSHASKAPGAPRATSEPKNQRVRDVTSTGTNALELLGRYGLPLILLLVLVLFSVWKGSEFFSWSNFKATFTDQAVILMVALGAMMPLIVGEFDLSVGANAGLAAIFAVGFSSMQDITPWVAIMLAVLISGGVGLINGLIVTRLRVNSFVATLGVATAIGGFGELYTHELDLQGAPAGLESIGRTTVASLPMTVIVAIVVAFALLVVLQYLPAGRQLLAVGSNRRAAELTGVRPERQIILAFVAAGVIVGVGGALYGANLGAASNSTGPTLLLPAFAGAFLGSTTISPGRFNVIGTIVGVLLLAFLVTGLEQVGVAPWVQPVVQGGALIAAVALSSWAIRARLARLRSAQLALLDAERDSETIARTAAPAASSNGQHASDIDPDTTQQSGGTA
jgi:ribose transport system permease protein